MIGIMAQYAQSSSGGSEAFALLFMVGLAVIFGAWSANAAERKGIPRSTGWLLGILLGLLGRIIVGVMKDQKTTVPVRRDLP
jgi:NhaP-type Na+/H+ or K+/H+ antiporter